MLFTTLIFIFLFLPLTIALSYLFRPYRNTILLLASLFFYAWGGMVYTFVLVASITINYTVGLWINKSKTKNQSQWALAAGIILNIGILSLFKYSAFWVENLNWGLALFGAGQVAHTPLSLPLGISFFTFQATSYLVDIYRKTAKVERNPIDLGLYISLFPQLIAGPIVRYHQIAAQLKKRVTSWERFAEGAKQFVQGLAKKVLLANTFGFVADDIFAMHGSQLTTSVAWLGIICFSLQIFFDFSGYSNMAIGLGRMFGFELPINFNFPYIAKSVREFWRRWHITLSTWFRDYVYIPLGGNRKGQSRVLLNLIIVFFIVGLWHGASWTFICWGLWHGLFMARERTSFGSWVKSLWLPLQHIYTLLIVVFGWVLFRAETFGHAAYYYKALFGFAQSTENLDLARIYINNDLLSFMAVALICCTPFWFWAKGRLLSVFPDKYISMSSPMFARGYGVVSTLTMLVLLLTSLMYLAADQYNPFIYFRF